MKAFVKSKNARWKILVIACILFCLFFTSISVSRKEKFYVDEVWSYSLSNSTDGAFYYSWHTGLGPPGSPTRQKDYDEYSGKDFIEYFDNWHDGSFYRDYLTVRNDERFDYGNVYYNQICDVHPPLYYFILHTVCSLTPGVFSKWQGLVPNLIFYTVTLIFLYLLARELTQSKKLALMSVLFWGLSGGAVSCTSFIRMYSLLTMFSVIAAYFYIMFYKTLKTRYAVLISVTVFLGLITQYSFYFFAFFITLIFCLYFLFKKKIKEFFGLGLSVLCSVAAAVAVFPMTYLHIFDGAYTDVQLSFTDNLIRYSTTDALDKLIKCFIGSFFYPVTYAEVVYIRNALKLFLLAVGLVIAIMLITKKIKPLPEKYTPISLLSLAAIITGIAVGDTSIYMPFCFERYFFFIFPFFAIIICCVILLVLKTFIPKIKKLKLNKKALTYSVAAGLCAVTICISNIGITNDYIQQCGEIDLDKELKDKPCFYIANNHLIHAFAPSMMEASRVYSVFVRYEQEQDFSEYYDQLKNMKEDYILIIYDYRGSPILDDPFHGAVKFPAGQKAEYLGKVRYTLEDDEYDVYKVTVK